MSGGCVGEATGTASICVKNCGTNNYLLITWPDLAEGADAAESCPALK